MSLPGIFPPVEAEGRLASYCHQLGFELSLACPAGYQPASDVLAAARRLEGIARRTPLERSAWLSERARTDVWLKLETHQRTGSFKLRGAYNAVATLSGEARARGLVTASAGNHGQGVALAASLAGLPPAVVFVPASAPEAKKRRIARYGADLRPVQGTYDDAHHAALAHAERTGGYFVNAFSDPAVVAGQGTAGLEIVQDLPGVRTILVPVGGGGISGGVGIVARAMGSGIRVIGVQTEATSAMHASLAAGRVATIQTVGSSGGLRVGADFLKAWFPDSAVWVSDPTARATPRSTSRRSAGPRPRWSATLEAARPPGSSIAPASRSRPWSTTTFYRG